MIDEITVVFHVLTTHRKLLKEQIDKLLKQQNLTLFEFQSLRDCEQALTYIEGTLGYFNENRSRNRIS